MKKQKTVSIKAKLLGVIIPVVIAIVVVLVVAAYQISAGTIKKYSQNLLQSSVENQASQIEAWLNADEEHLHIARQLNTLYLAVDTQHITKKIDTEKALDKVKSKTKVRFHRTAHNGIRINKKGIRCNKQYLV